MKDKWRLYFDIYDAFYDDANGDDFIPSRLWRSCNISI